MRHRTRREGSATGQGCASARSGTRQHCHEEMYSYLRPYLQRMEQPVRKRRNQKFSVSELDFKRLHGAKIYSRKWLVGYTLIKGTMGFPSTVLIILLKSLKKNKEKRKKETEPQ